MPNPKIKSFHQVCQSIENLRGEGKTVVLAHGCFDVLHVGHIALFGAAKKVGDILVVGVDEDASVREIKGRRRPIIPDKLRAQMVAALEDVDYVFVYRGGQGIGRTPTGSFYLIF